MSVDFLLRESSSFSSRGSSLWWSHHSRTYYTELVYHKSTLSRDKVPSWGRSWRHWEEESDRCHPIHLRKWVFSWRIDLIIPCIIPFSNSDFSSNFLAMENISIMYAMQRGEITYQPIFLHPLKKRLSGDFQCHRHPDRILPSSMVSYIRSEARGISRWRIDVRE